MTGHRAPGRTRVAYLVTAYPAVSHTFISTEVAALRAAGVGVRTFTVRPARADQLLTQEMRADAATTTALLPTGAGARLRTLVGGQLALASTSVRAWAAGLLTAARTGPATPGLRLRQLVYFLEAAALWRAMREDGLRHVHVHFANNGADVARLTALVGSRAEAPGTWTWSLSMHGPVELDDVWRYDLAAKTGSAAFVACISDFCRSQLMKLVEPARWPALRVVRMGVDIERFTPRSHARAVVPGAPLEVLSVGRLVPAKGLPVLVEALAALQARPGGAGLRVRVAGDGPMRPWLQQRIDEAGLAGVVTLLGAVGQDRLAELYRDSDAFCLPSLSEGLPVVLMEAMACALPVVTTAIAAVPELVRDGVEGLVVPPGRADALADALEHLRDDPDLRAVLGGRAREAVTARHSASAGADRLAELFADLPGAAPAAPVLLREVAPSR